MAGEGLRLNCHLKGIGNSCTATCRHEADGKTKKILRPAHGSAVDPGGFALSVIVILNPWRLWGRGEESPSQPKKILRIRMLRMT